MRRLPSPLMRHFQNRADCRTDGDLLAGFLGGTTETDFAELVRRHGPMVWGVCRRVLPDPTDAEDAFQATFLVLVRRARRLVGRDTVGPWLHQVAVWTARNSRRRNARQFAKRVGMPEQLPAATADPDLHLDLDAALLSLPEKFRSPIVLCHLLGFSRADAAERLGCPEGTLSAWLSRGLAKLRTKLGGLDPAKALGVVTVSVPAALSASAVRAAVASQSAVAVAVVSSTVSELVKGVVHMFWVKKATAASMALFAVFAMGVGVGISTRTVPVAEGQVKGTTGGASAVDPLQTEINKTIQELESRLRAIERDRGAAEEATQSYKEKLAALKARGADPIQLRESLGDLAKLQQDAEKAAAEVKLVKAKLDALRSLQAKEQPGTRPKPVKEKEKVVREPERNPKATPWATELDRQLAEMKAQLERFAVERQRLVEQRAVMEAKSAEMDRKFRAMAREFEALATKRAELTGRPLANREPGGYLELVVGGRRPAAGYSLRETDADGKAVGTVTVQEVEMLARLLSRAQKDPTAPKELRINIQEGANLDSIKVALELAKAAGFARVKVTGAVPPGIEAPDRERAPERRFMGDLFDPNQTRPPERERRSPEDTIDFFQKWR